MRYFTNILRWISSQEHLYFLFGLLFIIPNCVFLFTEPLPVPVGLASIVMPLAFWMGVLLLARKPGVVVWCLLPKIILDGGQLVLLYLFGESVIAVDMFLNLTSSNASEASELLGNIFLSSFASFSLYASYLVAGHAFNPHERQADCRVPQAVGVQKLGAFRSGGAALFPAFLAKA
mgnify:CR=1 FL=1